MRRGRFQTTSCELSAADQGAKKSSVKTKAEYGLWSQLEKRGKELKMEEGKETQPGEGGCVVSFGAVLLLQHVWGMNTLLWHLGIVSLWRPFSLPFFLCSPFHAGGHGLTWSWLICKSVQPFPGREGCGLFGFQGPSFTPVHLLVIHPGKNHSLHFYLKLGCVFS